LNRKFDNTGEENVTKIKVLLINGNKVTVFQMKNPVYPIFSVLYAKETIIIIGR